MRRACRHARHCCSQRLAAQLPNHPDAARADPCRCRQTPPAGSRIRRDVILEKLSELLRQVLIQATGTLTWQALRPGAALWYDRLGCGLSDRDGFDVSLDNDVEQLVSVLDAAGVRRADLIGYSFGAPPAAAFAARFPERVNRLIFYSAFARLKGHITAERMDVLKEIVRKDWALGSLALACRLLPNASSKDLRWFSQFQRSAATSGMAAKLLDHMWHLDVRDVLPELRCGPDVAWTGCGRTRTKSAQLSAMV
jgi:pimeloyl-ACP methyl ester carboxylesterase